MTFSPGFAAVQRQLYSGFSDTGSKISPQAHRPDPYLLFLPALSCHLEPVARRSSGLRGPGATVSIGKLAYGGLRGKRIHPQSLAAFACLLTLRKARSSESIAPLLYMAQTQQACYCRQ